MGQWQCRSCHHKFIWVATGVAFGTTPITATMEGKTSSIVDLAVISLSSITAMPASLLIDGWFHPAICGYRYLF